MNKNIKTALVIGGIIVAMLIVLPLLSALFPGWQGSGYGMMGPGMMGFGGGLFMPVFMVLFWGLIIWGVVALVGGINEPKSPDWLKSDSALDVLKKRYARGEINREEYEERKRDLVP